MRREFSAGGVLVRRMRGRWYVAAIRPGGKPQGSGRCRRAGSGRARIPGRPRVREVEEETGARGRLDRKLGDVRYVYTWDGDRIFKVVSFFLVRWSGGRLGDIAPEFAVEVAEVRWLPLEDAPRLLAYGGERDMVAKAIAELGV